MNRSELVASAVALRALGYDVVAKLQALVIDVASDAPAAAKLESGDVIVAVDGTPVTTPDELRREIGRRPGERVTLALRRDAETQTVTVQTVPSPADPNRPIVGISVDQDAKIKVPVRVDIDLGSVGGPSAGLPFALEIVDQLGRDVTRGCRIAATGARSGRDRAARRRPPAEDDRRASGGCGCLRRAAGENAAEANRHAGNLEVCLWKVFNKRCSNWQRLRKNADFAGLFTILRTVQIAGVSS